MKIVFFGTPQIACPVLEVLIKHPDFDVVAVVTQEDKPFGRKQILTPSPVKTLALQHNLQILQTPNLKKDRVLKEVLQDLNADFFVVLAFGQIIDQETLNIPKIAPINIHGSLLPKYRGASPIEEAILSGDTETGISIMKMVLKMDAGPVYEQIKIPILEHDNAITLREKMSQAAAESLPDILKRIEAKQLDSKPQNDASATYCHKITSTDAFVDFTTMSVTEIINKWRAYIAWPGIKFKHQNKTFKIHKIQRSEQTLKPGEFSTEEGLLIGTAEKSLEILELQPEGKGSMSARDFLRGNASFFQSN